MDRVSRVLLAVALIGAGSIQTAQAQVRTQPPVRSLVVPQQDQQQNQIQNQAATQTQIFTAPSIRNVRLDWCAHFGRDCGQVAADLFCREMQFERATRFAIDQNIGARGVDTLVFGDGALCHAPQCSGFRSITCQKTAIATQQAPARVPPLQTQQPTQRQPPPVVQQEEQPVITEEEVPPLPPTRQKPPVVVAQLPPLKIAPITLDVIELLKMGDIYLDDPRVEPKWHGDIGNPFAGDVPVWDDETVFKWHPSNPGMADTYDLRFFNTEAGGEPIGSVKLPGSKNFNRPSVEFLDEVLGNLELDRPFLDPNVDLKKGDIFWEVAGYRGYSTSGVVEDATAGGEKLDAQVAVSERWPIRAPDKPNGYGACGGDGPPEFNPANIEVQNPDAAPRNARRVSTTFTTASGWSGVLTGDVAVCGASEGDHGAAEPGQLINISSASISSTIYSSTGATARSTR